MLLTPLKMAGLTLLELLIVLVIMTQLALTVTANWQPAVENIAGYRVQNEITNAFQYARNEAVKSGTIATLCPLNTNDQCTSDWNSEVTLFLDPKNSRSLTEGTRIIKHFFMATSGTLKASKSGAYERRYFQYNPDGSVRGTIGNLIWCPASKNPQRAIQMRVNFGGRITWALDRDGDGTREDSRGAALHCS